MDDVTKTIEDSYEASKADRRYKLRVFSLAHFLAAFIQGKLFVQTGNHFPNPSLCKPFRSKRMMVL